ncbi:MAG: adenylyltransferase/cytidyltransferase family protein [Synergistaceae bacterium]|nr:adenylyltransferase/cytidyltransferase family protein [Synergistaceae bacterium]
MKKYDIGYTCGVFDMFNVGHLNLLERCKTMCRFLIVEVCDDEYIRNVKHTEPVIPQDDRVRILKALRCVDDAVLVDTQTTNDKMLALKKFRFNVLFSGDDWKGTERYRKTEEQFRKYAKMLTGGGGIAIEYLPYTHGISTTALKGKLKASQKI